MTEPLITYDERTTIVAFDASVLINGRLHLCLMQTAMPDMSAIQNDLSRQTSVAAMRHLLVGGEGHQVPALREMIPGTEPVLLVAPEFAFGSVDWETIDALVRQTNRPLLVSVGFGATLGQKLLDWQSVEHTEGSTVRHLSWSQTNDPISTAMPANGGWFWFHQPNEYTTCFTYLKNTSEQRVEAVELADLQHGRSILQIKFNDLDLFPLICSDLLQPEIRNIDSAQGRVRSLLDTSIPNRPALVVGSLLQHGYNLNWDAAVDTFLNIVLNDRASAVVLCNISHDNPEGEEIKDQWRSLSGVYGRWADMRNNQPNLPVVRSVRSRDIVGAVVRRTDPCVATGSIAWRPFNPVDGNFIWHAKMVCPIISTGLQAPIQRPSSAFACELTRYIRRRPPQHNWAPRVKLGLDQIATHISSNSQPDARRLFESMLSGVDTSYSADPDKLHLTEIDQACQAGLYALATLFTADDTLWQEDSSHTGQIKLNTKNQCILVWRDPSRTAKQMRRELSQWKLIPGEHPDLVVFGGGPHGGLPNATVELERRDDISLTPDPKIELGASGALAAFSDDITRPRIRRNVATVSLSDVTEVYTDYLKSEDQSRMNVLLGQIDSLFQEG